MRRCRSVLAWVAPVIACIGYTQPGVLGGAQAQSNGAAVVRKGASETSVGLRDLIDRYCVACHNETLRTAGLQLDEADPENVSEGAIVWEKVARKLRAGEMPPAGAPRPAASALEELASGLEAALDAAAAERPRPGHVTIHRLNRSEYENSIRDLLDLSIDGSRLLPADNADHQGFENIASVLSVSPALLEAYAAAAARISRLAVGDARGGADFEVYQLRSDTGQDDRMSEDLPFGSRGGFAVRRQFPVDGEYRVSVRLRRQLYDYIVGLGRPQRLQVRLDGVLVGERVVGGEDHGTPAPATFVGSILGDAEWEEYMHSADENLEVRFLANSGSRVLSVSFVRETSEPEGVWQPRNSTFGLSSNEELYGNAAIDTVGIGGPYNVSGPGESASRRRIFVCHPDEGADPDMCAAEILGNLCRRAYRRPSTNEDVETLSAVYKAGASEGGFENGVRLALQAILMDPEFLFRMEETPADAVPGAIYPVRDLDLASRLSFFLWSSLPDDELLDLAASGGFSESGSLERQVSRMLADDRSDALVKNFAAQWLDLYRIRAAAPDLDRFPNFDGELRHAFEKETELFLDSQVRGDRSVLELLDAKYTFVNERLAKHYGLPNVYGSHFRQFVLPESPRQGLLGQGSILTLTSYPNRTSPVLRGKWLLDNVLGMPPPPPPPGTPGLEESAPGAVPTSLRERMEQHRRSAACAACHVRMDPLGFALENFDAIGKWRDSSDGVVVDATASLPDGTQVDGATGLRRLLASRSEEFVRTVTEKLLTYALGRELTYNDFPAVRKIARDAAPSGYRWSALILGVTRSAPFRMSEIPYADLPERAQDDVRH